MSTHEFPIPVTDLDAGGKEFRFPVRAAWVRGALEEHEAKASDHDGEVAVRASKSGHDVVVTGTLDAELFVPCARCLEAFKLPIHSDLRVLFVPRTKADRHNGGGEADRELPEEEADTFAYSGETVALDDLVRDELLLEIPMIPLCSEACPGISPAPGSDADAPEPRDEGKGINPRLLPLQQFRAKKT